MELHPPRRPAGFHILALFLALLTLCCLIFTSCGPFSGTEGGADRRRTLAFLEPYHIKTGLSEGSLYELTPLADQLDGAVCAYGLYDEAHLILLREQDNTDRTDPAVSRSYQVDLLDLRDGSKQEMTSFDSVIPAQDSDQNDGSPKMPDPEIISAEPLIIHDRAGAVIYRPGTDPAAIVLPKWLRDACPVCLSGRLYLASSRGILFEILPDGSLHKVFMLPCDFVGMTPVISGHEGVLTFSTHLVRNPLETVYVDVDPVGGACSCYRSGQLKTGYVCCRDGLLADTSFRNAPLLSVYSPSGLYQKSLKLPDTVLEQLGSGAGIAASGSTDFISMNLAPLSLSGSWCCFALRGDSGRAKSLYLWDTAPAGKKSWKTPAAEPWQMPAPEEYGALTETAAELEKRYGVKIVLGGNIPSQFRDYDALAMTDPSVISGSLEVLDHVLSIYPDGYFEDLMGDYYRGIVFYLTGELTPLSAADNISNAGAFVTDAEGLCQIALNLSTDLYPQTIVHELTHAADYRFAGEGLWDESAWNALNPEGFTYYDSYIDENGSSYEFTGSTQYTAAGGSAPEDVWFIDPYSKTYAMEDRARLMEYLMQDDSIYSVCYTSPHIQKKLDFYFQFLRNTLGGRWPEMTQWEKYLREKQQKDAR